MIKLKNIATGRILDQSIVEESLLMHHPSERAAMRKMWVQIEPESEAAKETTTNVPSEDT